ncbi:hypothetical protein FRC07_001225 [Ceratobasidium sp. 392]|nr:hypothetical protein FRC07_001225 [Ceratobasidium sp. 392]
MPAIIIPVLITIEDEPRPFWVQIKHRLFVDEHGEEYVDIKDLIEQLLQEVFYYKAFARYERLWLTLSNGTRYLLLWNWCGTWSGTITAKGVHIPVARRFDVLLTLPENVVP